MVSLIAMLSLVGAVPAVTFGNSALEALEELEDELLAAELACALLATESEPDETALDAEEAPQAVNVSARHVHTIAAAIPVNLVLGFESSMVQSFRFPRWSIGYVTHLKTSLK